MGACAHQSRVEEGACIIGLEQLAKENESCRRSLGYLQGGFNVVYCNRRCAFASPSNERERQRERERG
jgi:hypothetical protein